MKKSLKLITSLCIGLLAVGAGVALSSVSKVEVKEAEAASGRVVYFTKPNYVDDDQVKTHTWEKGDTWDYMTHVFNNDMGQRVYRAELPSDVTKFQFQVYNQERNWKLSAVLDVPTNDTTGFYDQQEDWWEGWSCGTWTVYPYTLSFDSNTGDGEMNSQTAYGNVQWGIPACKFNKEGFSFRGWNTKADGSGTSYADKGLLPTKEDTNEIKLYAQWGKVYSKGRYIVGKSGDWSIENAVFMPNDGKQYVGTTDLAFGDEVKIAWYDGSKFEDASFVGYSNIIDSAEAKFCFSGREGDNIHCWAAATYTFYFGFDGNKLSVTYESTNAEILAAKILSLGIKEGHCGDDDRFPAMKKMYLELESGEQTKFQGFDTSSEAQFKNAYDRYVAWARALGEKPWEEGKVSSANAIFKSVNTSNSAVIIIICSVIAVGSISGFFYYRKRKHN